MNNTLFPVAAASLRRSSVRAAGFTLIELMVTVSLLVVVIGLAIPNLREFVVRNRMASLANEFSASVSQARQEAITRNTCVTMCQSATTGNAISGGALSCTGGGTNNWLKGWLIVTNPACNTTITTLGTPNFVIKVVEPPGEGYELIPGSGTPARRIMFDGRGFGGATMDLTLTTSNPDDAVAMAQRRQICVSVAGRVTVRKYEGSGCT